MHIEVFKKGRSWYWHFRSKGRITANAESFPSRNHATRAAKAVVRAVSKEMIDAVPVFSIVVKDKEQTQISWR